MTTTEQIQAMNGYEAAALDRQIRALRTEAAEHGDDAQKIICDIALGDEEPVTTASAWEERFGGAGFDADTRKAVLRIASVDAARAECAAVIADAAAQG